MINFQIFFLFLIATNSFVTYAKISHKRLCANEDCSEPVSIAKTLVPYISPRIGLLSFMKNVEVTIYSKSAGSQINLWGVEINGKRGYVPKGFLRETKIFVRKLVHVVDTDSNDATNNSLPTATEIPYSDKPIIRDSSETNNINVKQEISPDSVTPSYEVFGSTTVYHNKPETDLEDLTVPTTPSSIPSENLENSEKILIETSVVPTLSVTPNPKVLDHINVPTNNPKIENKEESIKLTETKNVENTENDSEDPGTFDSGDSHRNDLTEKTVDQANEAGTDIKGGEDGGLLSKMSDYLFNSDNVEEVDDEDADEDEYVDIEDDDIPDRSEINPIVEESLPTEIQKPTYKSMPVDEAHVNNLEPIPNMQEKDSSAHESAEISDKKIANDFELLNVNKNNDVDVTYEQEVKKGNESPMPHFDLINAPQENEINVKDKHELTTEDIVKPDNIPYNLGLFNATQVDVENTNAKQELTMKDKANANAVDNIDDIRDKEELMIEEKVLPGFSLFNIALKKEANLVDKPEMMKEEPIISNNSYEPVLNNDGIVAVINNDSKSQNTETFNTASLPLNESKLEIDYEKMSSDLPNVPLQMSNLSESFERDIVKEEILLEKTEQVNMNIYTTESPQEILPPTLEIAEQITTDYSPQDAQISSQEPTIHSENTKDLLQNSNEKTPETVSTTQNINNQDSLFNTTPQPAHNVIVNVEDKSIEENEGEEPGLFSKIYSGIFGSFEETLDSDQKLSKEVINNNVVEEVNSKDSVSIENSQVPAFEQHTHEKPFDKYQQKPDLHMAETVPNDIQSCERGNNPSNCMSQSENLVSDPYVNSSDEESWTSLPAPENAFSILLYLALTAITVLIFSLGYYYIEKKRIDCSLISSINTLEKKLLITSKESLILQDELKITKERLSSIEDSSFGSDEMVTVLKQELEDSKNMRLELEEQITNLERELETATEAGMELNRMLTEFLSSQNGSENLMENVEHLQIQLMEQQTTINGMNSTLGSKNMENELLQTELSLATEKIEQLQAELDKMVVNLLSVQEEKSKTESDLEEQGKNLRDEFNAKVKSVKDELLLLKENNNKLKDTNLEIQRALELKNNEYSVLMDSMSEVQAINSNKESLKALLDVSKVKAEVQQLREEKHVLLGKLKTEKETKLVFEKQIQVVVQEMQILKDKFDEADREKVEAQTRLDVLSGYFKEKEALLQKELNEHESMWIQKQGETTSTVERIKWIQEELQNYKSQNELLKKEILDQEVSLKSQISVLEKKSHDNWVLARQSERKLEESKQEASQLRNRLTIVEKNISNSTQAEDNKMQSRLTQSMESNGDIAVSPLHMSTGETAGSPPLLYPHRDHMTTSPPLPGMLPFMPGMPPPPGVPFMPPPMPGMAGVPPFMPPLPALFPGDHRPPPLGRMSSPPLHGRYSPDSRAFSPYERDDSPSMSPSYADSDYRRGRSPPPPHSQRNYGPYSKGRQQWEDMREYRDGRRMKPRSHKGTELSSGSGNSNESLDNSGRHSGRV